MATPDFANSKAARIVALISIVVAVVLTIGTISGANPNFSVGAPRTIMGTLQIGF